MNNDPKNPIKPGIKELRLVGMISLPQIFSAISKNIEVLFSDKGSLGCGKLDDPGKTEIFRIDGVIDAVYKNQFYGVDFELNVKVQKGKVQVVGSQIQNNGKNN